MSFATRNSCFEQVGVVASASALLRSRAALTGVGAPLLYLIFFFRHVRGIVDEENARILFPPVYQKLSVTKHAHIGVL